MERNLQDSSKVLDESMLNASGDWQHHMNMHLQSALDSQEGTKLEIKEEEVTPPFNDISLRIGNNKRNQVVDNKKLNSQLSTSVRAAAPTEAG